MRKGKGNSNDHDPSQAIWVLMFGSLLGDQGTVLVGRYRGAAEKSVADYLLGARVKQVRGLELEGELDGLAEGVAIRRAHACDERGWLRS